MPLGTSSVCGLSSDRRIDGSAWVKWSSTHEISGGNAEDVLVFCLASLLVIKYHKIRWCYSRRSVCDLLTYLLSDFEAAVYSVPSVDIIDKSQVTDCLQRRFCMYCGAGIAPLR